MIKKTKQLHIGDLFGSQLTNDSWALMQLCYIVETDGYLALTFALFNHNPMDLKTLENNWPSYDLTHPFIIATLDINPKKELKFLGNAMVNYQNVDIEMEMQSNSGSWGWYHKSETGLYPKFESYFGIVPWDLYVGKSSIEHYLVNPNDRPSNIRYLKEFTKTEIEALGLLGTIEYANRLDELGYTE